MVGKPFFKFPLCDDVGVLAVEIFCGCDSPRTSGDHDNAVVEFKFGAIGHAHLAPVLPSVTANIKHLGLCQHGNTRLGKDGCDGLAQERLGSVTVKRADVDMAQVAAQLGLPLD